MLRRVFPWVLGAGLLALLVSPFIRDLYHRYEFEKELSQLADPATRQALLQRYGSLAALGRDLARHCEAIYGLGEPSCERYRLSLRD
jgi:hypothetical protein